MEFLSAKRLEAMELEQLIAYKSLLTHISELKDFPGAEIGNSISEIKSLIEERLSQNTNGYRGISTREISTALVVKSGDTRFLDGMLEELRKAREAQEQSDKELNEKEQKEANIEVFKSFYAQMTYSMPEVVDMLGRETVLSILDKETLAKLVGMDKDSKSELKGKKDRNREVQIEH